MKKKILIWIVGIFLVYLLILSFFSACPKALRICEVDEGIPGARFDGDLYFVSADKGWGCGQYCNSTEAFWGNAKYVLLWMLLPLVIIALIMRFVFRK